MQIMRRTLPLITIAFAVFIIFLLNKTRNGLPVEVHPLKYFDPSAFYLGVSQADQKNDSFGSHISGGVVPHHLFAGFLISDFFEKLKRQQPKTLIIMGPNHNEVGGFKVLTSTYGWQTPFGIVNPDSQTILDLVDKNYVKVDDSVMAEDHAVSGLMPYVKYYLPNTEVVPVLLSGYMSQKELETFVGGLQDYLGKDTVLVASVDFSHGLNNQQAQENDNLTLQSLTDFNYPQLLEMDSKYLDSSSSIVTLLMAMRESGTDTMGVLEHTNSGEMVGNNSVETTSYFSIVLW
ncbi:MAG: hypothetical protein ACD_22C00118G0003 [uncultured bacterium]|nr:MAG: hypothetical protein ACD_22C00118G0003 [uncultured bacterium]